MTVNFQKMAEKLIKLQSQEYQSVRDCFFILMVGTLSSVLFVQKLGFYSDDWWWLHASYTYKDKSVIDFLGYAYSDFLRMRPVEVIYKVGSYRLFGFHAFGYHLSNFVILMSAMTLFYLSLKKLFLEPALCLSIVLVYALSPHYSTDRFWITTTQINISMTLYFLSFYSDLRCLEGGTPSQIKWKSLSILSMCGSVLSYELLFPFFFINPLFFLYRHHKLGKLCKKKAYSPGRIASLIFSSIFLLLILMLYKTNTSMRITSHLGIENQILWLLPRIREAFIQSYFDYGVGMPLIIFKIFRDYFDLKVLILGTITGILISGYLYHAFSQSNIVYPTKAKMCLLIVLGICVFVLGYSIFLRSQNIINTLTGIANRIAIAGSLGVAISTVGAVGLTAHLIPTDRLRKIFFVSVIAIVCTCEFIIINTIGSFWVEAYANEQEVLDKIRTNITTLPGGSTLLLDGTCPYVGPAIVFESSWDLEGALRIIYKDNSLNADIVKPNLKIGENYLSTFIYSFEEKYPYGNLFIFNSKNNLTYRLKSKEDAQLYFEKQHPEYKNSCPTGVDGMGVQVFQR